MTEVRMVGLMIVAGGLLLVVARRTGLPRSLLLIVCGILVGLVPRLPPVRLNSAIVLDLLLPPLLYAGTVTASRGLLRKNIAAALILGVLLACATTAAVAFLAHSFVTEVWTSAVLLGLIASVGGADELNEANERLSVPRRVIDGIRAESLLAPVVIVSSFLIAQRAAETGEFSVVGAAGKFAADIVGGGLLGAGVGYAVARLRFHIDAAAVEMAVSLATPYAAALLSSAFGLSPIPAILAASFIVAGYYVDPRTGKTQSSPATRLAAEAFWTVSRTIVGGVFLFLIGLSLPPALRELPGTPLRSLVVALAVLAVALAARFVFALAAVLLAGRARRAGGTVAGATERSSPAAEAALLTWAGTRSVIGVVVALAIPATTAAGELFPARGEIVALTCLVTLASLGLQGLTLAPVIRLLGFAGSDDGEREERRAREEAARAGLRTLDERARPDDAVAAGEMKHEDAGDAERRLRRYYERRLASDGGRTTAPGNKRQRSEARSAVASATHDGEEDYKRLREATLDAERRVLLGMHDRDELGDESYRRLVHEIDTEAERLASNGVLKP